MHAPAPIGRIGQQRPGRFAHGSGEVGHRGVHRDHQIHLAEVTGRVFKINNRLAQVVHIGMSLQLGHFTRLRVHVHCVKLAVRRIEQTAELMERDGFFIGDFAVGRAGPHEAHALDTGSVAVRERLQGALYGFQIGRAAQFRFLIQTHEVRQTHERGMHIVSRSGITGAHHAGKAGLLGEQSFELRLALEVHFLGVAQHLGKAHKHQCIAKTLFAAEQQAPAT